MLKVSYNNKRFEQTLKALKHFMNVFNILVSSNVSSAKVHLYRDEICENRVLATFFVVGTVF